VYFCPILTKNGIARHIFKKVSSIKFHENSSSGSHVGTCGQTDERTYRKATKLTGAFRDYATALRKENL